MKIVIDIDKIVIEHITDNSFDARSDDRYALVTAVMNGTPLDKIRERISLEKLGYPPSAGYYKAIMKVLQIIDKYNAESREV